MGSRRRFAVLAASTCVGATATTLASIAGSAATGGEVTWFPSVDHHPLLWLAGSVPLVAGSGVFGWWAQSRLDRGLTSLIPVDQRPEAWVVDRPAELGQIVHALLEPSGATVGITTGVHGAGGFGKTTLARLVRSDRRVLRHFRRRVYWVTLGRDVRRAALAEKVNDLVRQIDPDRAQPFTDVRQAANHLAAVLAAGPRRLIVLDDVWFEDQLAGFPVAGRCARLVTTRVHSLVAGRSVPVKVDQMSEEQARLVLTADLRPAPPPAIVDGLVAVAGRWPLLLRLMNRILVDQIRSSPDIAAAGHRLLYQLHRHGALQVDRLTGAGGRPLDINDPDERAQTVRATIEASTSLLDRFEFARFAEMAIFAEDETVPVTLVCRLWRATGGLDELTSRALCARLADLALLTLTPTGEGGTIRLHDVLRDYVRLQLGPADVVRLNQILLNAAAADLRPRPAVDHWSGRW